MRASAVLREAWRNIATGTTRTLTFACILVIIGGMLVIADMGEVRGMLGDAEAYRASGASTLTIVAPGNVDGRACEAMTQVDGVESAGALRTRHQAVVAAALPAAPIAHYEVTPGFPRVLSEGSDLQGVIVSSDVRESLALAIGDPLVLSDGTVTLIAGSFEYPSDGRRSGFGWSVLSRVTDDHPYDECWVKAWPQPVELPSTLYSTLVPDPVPGDETEPVVAQLNGSLGVAFVGSERLASRFTAAAPAVAAVLGLLLAAVAVHMRRLEIAANLHAGAGRTALLCMMLVEASSWILPGVIVCASTVLIIASPIDPVDRGALLVIGLKTPALLLVGACVGTALAGLLVREQHLFRYFKERR